MKKIIILLLASMFLVSCGAKNEEKIEETTENIVTENTKKLLPEQEEALEKFMQEYEENLRQQEFSEEVISEAKQIIREEKTAELLSN